MFYQKLYWTRIINLIIQTYLSGNTICIIWNDAIDFELEFPNTTNSTDFSTFVIINRSSKLQDFVAQDVIDYTQKREQLISNGIIFDEFELRLTLAIEKSHCDNFLAFEADIPIFIEAFKNASTYSVWRSSKNKFIFGYQNNGTTNYFQNNFFDEQPAILFIEKDIATAAQLFHLKTNIFIGPKSEERKNFYKLDTFNASNEKFLHGGVNLFPDKLKNLMGRELIVAALHYRPTVVLEYGSNFTYEDIAFDDPEQRKVRVDGTELRTLIIFCELYNCTLQINTAEADDWGFVYSNFTGFGTIGMVTKGTADVAIGAMYSWVEVYWVLDISMYLVRDGVTCVVPAPKRLTTWLLPLNPFDRYLWAAVIIYLIIETFSIFIAHKLESIVGAVRDSWWQSFYYAYSLTFKIFISQSGGVEKIFTSSLRLLLFSCFLIDIIVTSVYGGGLASILTVPSFEEAADTLQRFRSHGLKWGASSEAWLAAIHDTDDPLLIDFVSKFEFRTDEELLALAAKGEMGFSLERLPFGHFTVEKYLIEDSLRHMKIMSEDIYFAYTVTITTRLWPLLESYNNLIYNWHSSGFDKYWEWRIFAENMNMQIQKIIESSAYSPSTDDLGPVPLDMSNFAGMLIIWVLGIFIAILSFLGELLYERLMRQRQASEQVELSVILREKFKRKSKRNKEVITNLNERN